MFINRENELKKLNSLFALKKASIVVCKGRRRIGKSRLIEEFGKSAKTLYRNSGTFTL
jgi:Predicted ATPase (AAA+ superfamily)